MNEPIAYCDGRTLPLSEVSVSLFDTGFVLGATVAEQLRTFGGKVFRFDEHLARLWASLEIVGIEIGESADGLAAIGRELVAANHPLLEAGDDLGLAILVTPGGSSGYRSGGEGGPTVILHTYPLPFCLWQEKYGTGQTLRIPQTRQVPSVCWPSALKCRSRMHYYLADQEARAMEPGSRALLLDVDGHVTEASTANVIVFRKGEGLISPPREKVLPGISLASVMELGEQLGVSHTERDLWPDDLWGADEVLLTSTPFCVVPVTSLDGRVIGGGGPGEFYGALIEGWSGHVGIDIVGQARRFAVRR